MPGLPSCQLTCFLVQGADSVADSAKDVASSGPSLPFGKSGVFLSDRWDIHTRNL